MRRKKSSKADATAAFLRPSSLRVEAAPVPSAQSGGASLLIRLLARSSLLTALILWKRRPYWPAWFVARLPRPFSYGPDAETRQTPTPTRAPRR
jgi:hypothetical protein